MSSTTSEACTYDVSRLINLEHGQDASSRKRRFDLEIESSDNDHCERKKISDTKPKSKKFQTLLTAGYSMEGSPSESKLSSTPDDFIKQLMSDLKVEEERLRKLKMVKMYREKNNLEELKELIGKWRSVCQESLQDLQEIIPPPCPTLKQLLDHLQIEHDLVHFDPDMDSFS